MAVALTEVSGTIQVLVKSSMEDISEAEWDGLNAEMGLFLSHRFFRAVQNSGVEAADYSYVLIYSNDALIGTAVISSFEVALDLLMPLPLQRLCRMIRRALPRFMRIRVLFCGLPVSIGKCTIAVAAPIHAETVLARVVETMKTLALKRHIRYLCFKEFNDTETPWVRALEHQGFFRAHSLPRIRLPLRWNDFSSYLDAMRHDYRRQIKSSLRKLGADSPLSGTSEPAPTAPRIVVDDGTFCPPATFYRLYRQVMDHTAVKLEILNQRFFEELLRRMRDDLQLLVLEHNGVPLAAALLASHRRELIFLFVGLDYARRDEHASYINLLSGIVDYGIAGRYRSIDLGQTSYWLKQRLGGEPEPLHFYLRAQSRFVHSALSVCRGVLFPHTSLPKPRVFHA